MTGMPSPQDGGPTGTGVSPGRGQTRLHPRCPPRPSPHPLPPSGAAATQPPVPGPAGDPSLPGSAVGRVLSGGVTRCSAGGGACWPRPSRVPAPRLQDTSMAPQKATFWTPGWAARTGPREAGPLITLRIPGNGPSSPASWARRRGVGEAGGTRTTTVQPGGSRQLKTEESRPPGPSSPNPGVRNPCPSSLRPRGPAPATTYPQPVQGKSSTSCRGRGRWGAG